MTAAVSVHHLTKRFSRVTALADVTFEIPAGSLFGLLGPNGAGKTTLFSVAAGFLRPTEGSVEVLGVDVAEISQLRGRFSMLPQDAAFQGGIPVLEQLVMFGRLNGYSKEEATRRSHDALALVGLDEVAKKSARTLSHGMMKRVVLCQAFLGEPEVILLDEPTSGLDPETARQVRDLIHGLRRDRTIVVSSHNLREIQEICDHAAILDEGRLEVVASMAELTSASFLLRIQLTRPLTEAAEQALLADPEVKRVERTSETELNLELSLASPDGKEGALERIQRILLVDHGLVLRSLHEGASLEARFLEITGGTYDGASAT